MSTVEELQEKAVKYFCVRPSNFPVGRPYNCCESVLSVLNEYLDVGRDLIPKIGAGIGAGVSRARRAKSKPKKIYQRLSIFLRGLIDDHRDS